MNIIGMCGRSGSGKGSVGEILRAKGIPVLDTDKLYHDLINDPDSSCTHGIVKAFGSSVLGEDKRIDRKQLGQLVFGEENKEKLALLNSISHAFVKEECEKWLDMQKEMSVSLVCLDVPLLFESNMNEICQITLAVIAPQEVCVKRIIERDKIDKASALRRLDAQIENDTLSKLCQYTICNDGTLEELTDKVETFLKRIQYQK